MHFWEIGSWDPPPPNWYQIRTCIRYKNKRTHPWYQIWSNTNLHFDIKIDTPTPGIKYQPAFWYKNRHTHPPNCYDIDTNWYLMKWLSLTTYKPDKSNHKPALWIYDITIEREQACMGNCLKQFNQWKSVNNIHIDKENKSILIKVNF